jgi:lipopolysaccharide/colanic/teichoic acid biosynthesis glycosyltransferase/NDP-sugar pyrophosphorylase family protein
MSPISDTAVVLAGGLATFHGFALATYPKILLPLANRPLLHYQAQALAAAGVKHLIICVNQGLRARLAALLDFLPRSLECRVKESDFGTGGSLKEVQNDVQGRTFWVVSGDLLLAEDLTEMLDFHQRGGAMATVGVMRVREAPWEMERVEFDADQQVKAIHRLHPAQEKRSTLRPAGLYLFQPGVLEVIPPTGYFDLKEQLFVTLYQRGTPAQIWEMPGYSRTITSVGDFFSANLDVLMGQMPFSDRRHTRNSPEPASGVQIGPSARVLPPVLVGPDSRVGDDAIILGPTVIGSHCQVDPGVVINECIILDNACIRAGAYLHRCVISEGAVISNGGSLREIAVLQSLSNPEQPAVCSLRADGRRHPGYVVGPLEWQTLSGPLYQKTKRVLDVILAALGLALAAPIMAVIALAIKLDSPGPIFFRQERCGQGGRNFVMVKFRSMVSNSEDLKRELQDLNEVDGPMFKIIKDPRITRVGKILRDTNLDELPQLWNVLKGDMSLVGPRPLSLHEMFYNPRWRDARLSVRPGMTGLWQLEAHTKVYFNDWIINDLEYVKYCSLWLDAKILFKTLTKTVKDLLRFGPE